MQSGELREKSAYLNETSVAGETKADGIDEKR